MPTSASKVCRFQDGSEVPIQGVMDYDSCRYQGGEVVDAGADAGQSQQERISGRALRAQLTTERWRKPVGESGLQVRDFGAILLSFPLCEIQRRVPDGQLVQLLNRIDSVFAGEVIRLIEDDDDLREAVYQFIFRTSSAAAVALANDGAEATAALSVSKQLVDEGIGIGRDIASRTANAGLVTAIRDASDIATTLVGVPLSEVLGVLRGPSLQRSPSPVTAARSTKSAGSSSRGGSIQGR